MKKLLPLIMLALVGCKDVGDACEVTGNGFSRRDPCEGSCLNWTVTCPDGHEFTPNECAGALCAEDGVCPEGQVCFQVDSFPGNARCVRAAMCEER